MHTMNVNLVTNEQTKKYDDFILAGPIYLLRDFYCFALFPRGIDDGIAQI